MKGGSVPNEDGREGSVEGRTFIGRFLDKGLLGVIFCLQKITLSLNVKHPDTFHGDKFYKEANERQNFWNFIKFKTIDLGRTSL